MVDGLVGSKHDARILPVTRDKDLVDLDSMGQSRRKCGKTHDHRYSNQRTHHLVPTIVDLGLRA